MFVESLVYLFPFSNISYDIQPSSVYDQFACPAFCQNRFKNLKRLHPSDEFLNKRNVRFRTILNEHLLLTFVLFSTFLVLTKKSIIKTKKKGEKSYCQLFCRNDTLRQLPRLFYLFIVHI